MANYNIIYTSQGNDQYLWNGTGFDKLDDADQQNLMFSGKNYDDDEITEAILKCHEMIKRVFPSDNEPDIKPIEIQVTANKKKKD